MNLFYECKYGWNDFIYDYRYDKLKAIKKHTWLFNESSKDYIDYKLYINDAHELIVRSRQRIDGLRKVSIHMINSIEARLKKN